MNVLDENIVREEREHLQSWNVHFRLIGDDLGRLGMKDRNEIIPLSHNLRLPTFFPRDRDFYRPDLRHAGYCLVFLDVAHDEAAQYISRFLRLASFRSRTQRMGKVVRVRRGGVSYWQVGSEKQSATSW
ncbi:MAG: hypothetical protein AABN34_22500 [Acidobacteriota bacterium]